MADGKKDRVGIVGAGRMGLSMLKQLVNKGYTVTVCDISEKQREAAHAAGAAIATTPAEVGKASDIVILGVGYDDEVNEVVFGKTACLKPWRPVRSSRCRRRRRAFCRRFRNAAGVGGRQTGRRRPRAVGLWHLRLRYCASWRRRSWPDRQDDEQLITLGERHWPFRGRPACRDDRHRSRKMARSADDELWRIRRVKRVGYDLFHLGVERYANCR
jgi:hypothetical protein